MELLNIKDAEGNQIIVGQRYGFTKVTNGITKVTIGTAKSESKSGKFVTLKEIKFRKGLYGNMEDKWTYALSETVSAYGVNMYRINLDQL